MAANYEVTITFKVTAPDPEVAFEIGEKIAAYIYRSSDIDSDIDGVRSIDPD